MPSGLDRECLAGDGICPGAVTPQQPGQARGEGDNAGVLVSAGDVVEAGEQAGTLGPGPGKSLLSIGHGGNRGRDRAVRRGESGAGLAGEEGVGPGGGVVVVIQQPDDGIVPVMIRVQAPGQGAGVLADQVVHPVPALGRLGEQVLVVQGLQAAASGRQVSAVQGGGGVAVDVGAGVQPEPPEQPLLVLGQVVIGQVECGGHGQVLGGHQLQPVPG